MAKGRLSARAVETAKVGRHGDGQGLILEVSPKGFKRWIYRYTVAGKTVEVALGRGHTLERARDLAEEQRRILRAGLDPAAERRKAKDRKPVPTFAALAEDYIATKSAGWKSQVHLRQWKNSLSQHAGHIAEMPVDRIEVSDILSVLQPIWLALPETASRIRNRIELVLDYAKAHGHRTGDNPAAWRGGKLSHLLPAQKGVKRLEHFGALHYDEVPALVAKLRSRVGVTALLLEFQLLTATRPSEARCMEWSEVDFDAAGGALWVIPAERTKQNREMRVPLSDRAVQILRTMQAARINNVVFTSPSGGFLNSGTLNAALKRFGYTCTPHGTARSSFRDWAGDRTAFPKEVAEAALGHVIGDNATERAYRRGDALELRRRLMAAWAAHCEGDRADNVLPFGKVSA